MTHSRELHGYLHSGPWEVHVKLSHALAAGWWNSVSLMALNSSSP